MSEMSVASINERAADEYFKRGQDAIAQGLQEKAVDYFERALNENPDHESACFNLALASLLVQRFYKTYPAGALHPLIR